MKMKKVLSLVLSLCFIVSLGAGLSFNADAAFNLGKYDLYWNFMKTNIGTTGEAYLQSTDNISYNTTGAGNAGEVNTNIASQAYAFFDVKKEGANSAGHYAQYASSSYGILMYTCARSESITLAMKLWSNKAGKYVPMINIHGFTDYANATTYDFYIVPMAGSEKSIADINLANAIAHKAINFGAYGTYDEFVPLSDTPVDIQSAKEYLLVVKSNNGGKGSICFDGVLFKEASAADLTAIQMNMGHEERYYEVQVGEKLEVPFSLTNAAGGKVDLSKTAGWAEADDTAAVHLRTNIANGTIDITGQAVNDKPETMWVRYGTAAVYFNVKVVDEAPKGRDHYYDWHKAFAENTTFGGDSDYPETVTMGMTTVGSHNEINRWTGTANHNPDTVMQKGTASIYSDPIGFYQKDATAIGVMAYHNYAMYHSGTGNYDLIFKVTADGSYLPKVVLTRPEREGTYKAGSAHTISILSLDGKTNYGSVSVAKGQGAPAVFAKAIDLEKGDYILRFNQTTAGTNFFDGLSLEYKGGLTYNVTLNANGGTVASELTSYTEGTAVALPAATKEGYKFDGWFDNAELTGAAVTEIPATAKGDKVYYAKFTYIPKTFAVTLNANGGTVAADLTSYTEFEGATLPAATKANYIFGGWYDNADLIGTAVTAIAADATGAKEYWAKWTLDVTAADFDVTSDSGYYAYYISNPYRTGEIVVNAAFNKASAMSSITKAGIMVYTAGNEENDAKIARVEVVGDDLAALATSGGKVSAKFTGIAKENFGKEVITKAYVVIDGQYVYSDATLANVEYAKWIGVPVK